MSDTHSPLILPSDSATSKPSAKKIVKQLMESDNINELGLPDGFDVLDPAAFVQEVAKYRQKALGTSKHKHALKVYAWGDPTIANTLLKVYEKAQPHVTGQVMQTAVEALQISMDYSVMGSDTFMPKLLPNGAVLIRNHHRVIAIDESPSVRLNIANTQLRAELEKVIQGLDHLDDSEDSLFQYFLLHRLGTGEIVRTRTLPEKLSDWGQTLVFIGSELDLSASEVLTDADIASVCRSSRTGTAIVRVFANCALVYGTYRASDEFDTILEDHCEHVFYELDAPAEVTITQDYKLLQTAVAQRTRDLIECHELEVPSSRIMQCYFDEIMVATQNWNSYANQKLSQITGFTPFFHQYPDQPTHYYAAMDPYWNLSKAFEHKVAILDVPMQLFSDIDDFEHQFLDAIQSRLLGDVYLPAHRLLLQTEEIQIWHGREHALELESKEVQTWVKARAEELRENFKDAKQADPDGDEVDLLREVLTYGNTQVRLILAFDEKPDYVALNDVMKQISAQFEGGTLHVPCMGFCQGYDDGGYDTGNAPVLLTPTELEGDGDEDNYEAEDED